MKRKTVHETMSVNEKSGSEGYFIYNQVISLCERLAGQNAKVTTVPVAILRFTRQLTRFFQWTNDAADRLAFSEVIHHTSFF